MRILTPGITPTEWFLTLFFREVGHPIPFSIGPNAYTFGRGREFTGSLSVAEMQYTNEPYSLSLRPGARLLGVSISQVRVNIKAMAEELIRAKEPEVELTAPSGIVTIDDPELASDLLKHNLNGYNDSLHRDLEVLNGNRRRFYGKG